MILKKIRLANPTLEDLVKLNDVQLTELLDKEKYKLQEIRKKIHLTINEAKKQENKLQEQKKHALEKITNIEIIGKQNKKTLREYTEHITKIKENNNKLQRLKQTTDEKTQEIATKFNNIAKLIDLIEEAQLIKIMKKTNINKHQAKKYIHTNKQLNKKRLLKIKI